MAFDVQGARAAGYSDAEIADHLAQGANFDAAGARKSGYSDADLITHLAPPPTPPPTFDDYGREVKTPAETPGIPVVGGNAPGYRQSEVLPLARRQDVINDPNSSWYQGWALAPGPFRAVGQTPAENTTIDPNTGTMNIAPEALAAATALGGVGGLRFGAPEPVPPGLAAREAPMSADFRQAPIAPPAAAKIAATPPGDLAPGVPVNQMMPQAAQPRSPGTGPDRQNVDPTKPVTYNPPSGGWPAGTESWAAPPSSPTGIPVTEPRGPMPPATVPPWTSGRGFDVSKAYYDTFDQAAKDGGSLTPNVANKVISTVESEVPKPGMAEAFGAGDKLKGIVDKLQAYKDQPMSLDDVKAVDQQLGDLIHAENDPIKGMSPYGRVLSKIQDDVRDLTENPSPSDVVGGQAGLDALAPARQAYSQAKKMQEIERLWDKSQGTQNPTTSYQTQINNLFANRRRSAGFTDDEVAAVKDAASRGVIGGGIHLLGSRLMPIIAAAAEGGTHGLTAGTAAFATTYLGGTAMRALENRLAASRFEGAREFLGRGIPSMPVNGLGPPPI